MKFKYTATIWGIGYEDSPIYTEALLAHSLRPLRESELTELVSKHFGDFSKVLTWEIKCQFFDDAILMHADYQLLREHGFLSSEDEEVDDEL